MKLKRTKRGFTIIELVIVIAVIGILAAVLIPTFVNLTNKANEAADNALVNNLNKALKMEEQEPGHQKAPTLEGAIQDLEDQGYLLENLASKSGKDLLWSQSENQFLLNTEGKSGKDYWKIVDAMPAEENQKYSYYAGKNFKDTNVTAKYGFDAGRNDGIAKVTYKGTGTAQEVAIRTNGEKASLVVNAPTDVVHHYDFLDELNVEAIASASYHEHGRVRGKATISNGHIAVEQGAAVSQIIVSEATGAVTITANEATTIFVDSASANNTSVVANSNNINVAGLDASKISGDKSSDVKTSVLVTSEAELNQAITNKKPFVQLGADFTLSTYAYINIEMTLDLNGHVLTGPSDNVVLVFLKKNVITDSVGTGKVIGACPLYPLQVNADLTVNGGTYVGDWYALWARRGSKATINAGTFEGEQAICVEASHVTLNNAIIQNTTWGITVYGNGNSGSSTFIMNGGKVTADSMAISGNGNAQNSGTVIEIHAGQLEATDDDGVGVYIPQNGTVKIDGNATLKGSTALYIKSGTTSIKGGSFIATLSPKADYNFTGNGANPTGDAIVIDACNYPGGNPCVEAEISNASFSLADTSAKRVAYYSHDNGAAVVVVDGQTLEPIIG